MNNSTFIGFQDNNFENDRNLQSIVAANASPPAEIQRAIFLWEQANELLIESGRLLAQAKDQVKRKFTKLIEGADLAAPQATKLIKAAQIADEIPPQTAARLGLPMLLQLGQARNQAARVAIAPEDTQATVAQKIKDLRLPTTPKEKLPIHFVGNQKGGVGKLRIEIPGCPEAVNFYNNWKESGLPPLQWLLSLTFLPPQIEELASSHTESEIVLVDSHAEQAQLKVEITLDSQDTPEQEIEQYLENQVSVIAPKVEPSAILPIPTADQYYLVLETGDQWEGEVVRLIELGNYAHKVGLVDSNQWHYIGHKYLQPLTPEAASGFDKNELTQQIALQYGFAIDVQVEWVVGKRTLKGKIRRLTKLGAFVDEGCPGFPWVKYQSLIRVGELPELQQDMEMICPRLDALVIAVLPQVLLERQLSYEAMALTSTANVQMSVMFLQDCYKKASEPEYQQITDCLKKAKNWEEVSSLVEQDSNILAIAINNWELEEKEVLIKHLINYLETERDALGQENESSPNYLTINHGASRSTQEGLIPKPSLSPGEAIIYHQIDWIPMSLLEKAFEQVVFKVHDIVEGLVAPWHSNCEFISVNDFGKEDEVWTFVNNSIGQEIKVYDRADFAVVAF